MRLCARCKDEIPSYDKRKSDYCKQCRHEDYIRLKTSGELYSRRYKEQICIKCQQLFTKFFPPGQSLEQRVALAKQMGCCQLLPMIYDLDDNTVPENVEFYHSLFTNSMCPECQEIIDLAQQKKLYQTKNE